jgi:hypothetical protein
MVGLSEGFFHADPEVVLEALTAWCIRTHGEPDDYLISLAITLYNDGNNTPEHLLQAREIEFAGDAIPLSRLGPLSDLTVNPTLRVLTPPLRADGRTKFLSIQTAPGSALGLCPQSRRAWFFMPDIAGGPRPQRPGKRCGLLPAPQHR